MRTLLRHHANDGRAVLGVADVAHRERCRHGVCLPRGDSALPDASPDVPCDLVDRARRDDAASAHHEDLVGDVLHIRDDVRGKDDDLVLGERGYEVAEADALLGVEPCGGLVEHEDRRVVEHRLGDAEPLLHAAGEGLDLPFCGLCEADNAQEFACTHFCLLRGEPLERCQVHHEVARREIRVVAEVLGQVPEARPIAVAKLVYGDAPE